MRAPPEQQSPPCPLPPVEDDDDYEDRPKLSSAAPVLHDHADSETLVCVAVCGCAWLCVVVRVWCVYV